ncbi:channel-forming protein ArfA/OmpATb [Gephyromycinifex aptenodytis]|uniref:channel-forming protein ArfA/OmpATb n=1 Tax=Gephyromycinifex aptenodytis TaxID=2716227 RepID=UPI0014456C0A|nr:hypothetical protein [Gephyromycinifex aptenodytis]
MSRPDESGATAVGKEPRRTPKPWLWLLALVLLALLIFGLSRLLTNSETPSPTGAATASSSASESASPSSAPQDSDAAAEAQSQGPVQLTRNAEGITVQATVPDEPTKASLLQVVKARANGAEIIDKVEVSQGQRVADFAGLLPLLAGAKDVDDVDVRVEATSVTVQGAAKSQEAKTALEEAAARAFPHREVDTQISAPAPATPSGSTGEQSDGATASPTS